MIPDYTVVLGVDKDHEIHLQTILPNWLERKPKTFRDRPFLIFFDSQAGVRSCLDGDIFRGIHDITCIPWPTTSECPIEYEDDESSRFGRAQRYKMLSGFVHIPAMYVRTPYWLKLDLDVVASGNDDWIDEKWFEDRPAIIASPWGYTKPADQMMKLDAWVDANRMSITEISTKPALNLKPMPGSDLVKHKRIISWCAFFDTSFTTLCSLMAKSTCGIGKLPVPSQDGYMWYVAERSGLGIVKAPMKSLGWIHCQGLSSMKSTIASL